MQEIQESIVENHRTRMRIGDASGPVKVTINLFNKVGEQITKRELDKILYNKRKDTNTEYLVEKQILKHYNNYEEYIYKWVLFDITDKRIIAYNQELIEIIEIL